MACSKYRALPKAGGVLDQPNKLMQQFMIIENQMRKEEAQANRTLEVRENG